METVKGMEKWVKISWVNAKKVDRNCRGEVRAKMKNKRLEG